MAGERGRKPFIGSIAYQGMHSERGRTQYTLEGLRRFMKIVKEAVLADEPLDRKAWCEDLSSANQGAKLY